MERLMISQEKNKKRLGYPFLVNHIYIYYISNLIFPTFEWLKIFFLYKGWNILKKQDCTSEIGDWSQTLGS